MSSPSFHNRRWHLPDHAAEVMAIFGFPDGADTHGDLWWRTHDSGDFEFYADCSDTFAWGTADSERIDEADLPLLRRCLDDLRAVGTREDANLAVLFAARKRRKVPMPRFLERESEAVRRLLVEAGRRPVPAYVADGLEGILEPEGWEAWMGTEIMALGFRTPWECIEAGDRDAVLRLLASYQDPSFS